MDKNIILVEHAQRYIRAVMADRLRQEGFVSKDGMDIHWYRIVNNEVVQAIYFYTRHTALPMFLGIGYGSHPLFIMPEFPRGVYLFSMHYGPEKMHPGRILMKNGPNRFSFDSDTLVSCPDDDYVGLDLLEEILRKLNEIQTPFDCYMMHKKNHLNKIPPLTFEQAFSKLSTEYMDEVVYWGDQEMYPYCVTRINSWLEQLERDQQRRKLCRFELAQMDSLSKLLEAVIEGHREEHLIYLEKCKQKTIQMLKKNIWTLQI